MNQRKDRLNSIAPLTGSEKRKFLEATQVLSDCFRKSCDNLIDESFIRSMSKERLLEEGSARRIYKHNRESWDQYRVRVEHAEVSPKRR